MISILKTHSCVTYFRDKGNVKWWNHASLIHEKKTVFKATDDVISTPHNYMITACQMLVNT